MQAMQANAESKVLSLYQRVRNLYTVLMSLLVFIQNLSFLVLPYPSASMREQVGMLQHRIRSGSYGEDDDPRGI